MSDQRVRLKFYVENGIRCSEAFKMLKKAFGDNVYVTSTNLQEAQTIFHKDREDVEDDASVLAHQRVRYKNVEKKKLEIALANRH